MALKHSEHLDNTISARDLWERLVPLYGEREAKALTFYVLELGFSLSRADALLGKIDELKNEDKVELERIFSRLEKSEPVQYILSQAEFSRRRFIVRPGVLIPRQETAELCEIAMTLCKDIKRPKILDIGTGSGCIAITLALDIPLSKVHAWDISSQALEIAKENDKIYSSNVKFSLHDIFNVSISKEKWDIIVSNPPYILEKEKNLMNPNVIDYEPHEALFVPNDKPLIFYDAIASYAIKTLNPNGKLLLEINPLYQEDLQELIKEKGFTSVEIKEDMFGKKRFAACYINHPSSEQKSEASAFSSLSSLCASQERCSNEIREKMKKWSLSLEAQERVLKRLIDEGFVNDERYSRAFVRDKIRFNKWGRKKVEQALYAKKVDSKIYKSVLDEIDDEDYLEVLKPLLKSKSKSIKAKNEYEFKNKLMRFALGRGFSMDIIKKCLDD